MVNHIFFSKKKKKRGERLEKSENPSSDLNDFSNRIKLVKRRRLCLIRNLFEDSISMKKIFIFTIFIFSTLSLFDLKIFAADTNTSQENGVAQVAIEKPDEVTYKIAPNGCAIGHVKLNLLRTDKASGIGNKSSKFSIKYDDSKADVHNVHTEGDISRTEGELTIHDVIGCWEMSTTVEFDVYFREPTQFHFYFQIGETPFAWVTTSDTLDSYLDYDVGCMIDSFSETVIGEGNKVTIDVMPVNIDKYLDSSFDFLLSDNLQYYGDITINGQIAKPDILGKNKINFHDLFNRYGRADVYHIELHLKGLSCGESWIKFIGWLYSQGTPKKAFELPCSGRVVPGVNAETNSFTGKLGTSTTNINTEGIIKSATFKGVPIDIKQCKLSFPENQILDVIQGGSVKAKVMYGDYSNEVIVPYTATWGNTLALQGLGITRTIAAYPIVNGTIFSVAGSSYDNDPIHSRWSGYDYCSLDFYSFEHTTARLLSPTDTGEKHVNGRGEDLKTDFIKRWKPVKVNTGDVIKVHHEEPEKNSYYDGNEVAKNETNGYKDMYYCIENDKYRPLHFNQLKTIKIKVPIGVSKEYFDQHINEFIDNSKYPEVKINKFIIYPNANVVGEQHGQIQVSETSGANKTVLYNYDIVADVQGALRLDVPSNLKFADLPLSKERKLVKIEKMQKDVTISDTRKEAHGGWKLMLKVSAPEDIRSLIAYKDGKSEKNLLNSVCIYDAGAERKGDLPPEVVNVSKNWSDNTGILLDVPEKTYLETGTYYATFNWSIVMGP